jgi:hypothetical protein
MVVEDADPQRAGSEHHAGDRFCVSDVAAAREGNGDNSVAPRVGSRLHAIPTAGVARTGPLLLGERASAVDERAIGSPPCVPRDAGPRWPGRLMLALR